MNLITLKKGKMNPKTKRIGLSILILLFIFLVTAGFLKKYNNEKAAVVKSTEENKTIKEAPVKAKKKDKFESNAEIKQEYGKLETVFLWNGRSYTGAVISTTEIYTIVTTEGTVNIPMKDVKMREIIR